MSLLSTLGWLIKTVLHVWAMVCFIRIFLQVGGLSYRHDLAKLCCKITDFLVRPLRRVIPSLGALDTAGIVAAFMACLLSVSMMSFLDLLVKVHFTHQDALLNVVLALVYTVDTFVSACIAILVMAIVVSFSKAHHDLNTVLQGLIRPFCRPFMALRIGMFDFSVVIVLLGLQLISAVLIPQLIGWLRQLMA